jgi:hypothetical protein
VPPARVPASGAFRARSNGRRRAAVSAAAARSPTPPSSPGRSPSAAPAVAPSVGLARKLGVGPGDVVALLGAPPAWSAGELPAGARLRRGLRGPADIVIAFLRRASDLDKVLPRVVPALGPQDALWLAWPRRAAGHTSDLNDNLVRGAALETGLVDVKVAALGEDWSGLRFVWRRERRDEVRRRRAPADRP